MTYTPLPAPDLDAMLAVEGHMQRTAPNRFRETAAEETRADTAATVPARNAAPGAEGGGK